MDIITSKKNPIVAYVKSLYLQKYRLLNEEFICDGPHMVQEASLYNLINYIIVSKSKLKIFENLIVNKKYYVVDDNIFKFISQTVNPQGIMAIAKIPKHSFSKEYNKIVLLNAVQDPGNLGTIIRTAAAAGFDCIVSDHACCDYYNDKCLRSTMGSIFKIPCIKTLSLYEFCNRYLLSNFYDIYSSIIDGNDFYSRQKDSEKLALVIGNEGNGIDKELIDISTHHFSLKMNNKVESLNASVAAGIMMYDIMNKKS